MMFHWKSKTFNNHQSPFLTEIHLQKTSTSRKSHTPRGYNQKCAILTFLAIVERHYLTFLFFQKKRKVLL